MGTKATDIKDPIVKFVDDPKGMIGFVTFEGSLNGLTPVEAHLDTQRNKLTMLFNNGSEIEIVPLSKENVTVINSLHGAFNARASKDHKLALHVGFFGTTKGDDLTEDSYYVPAMVI